MRRVIDLRRECAGVFDPPFSVCSRRDRGAPQFVVSPSKHGTLKTEHAISRFAARVYAALQRVPRGRVITYAALARRIRCGSPRAVGQALRANPFAPKIPCHRVIASDLTPGGFLGKTRGPELKRKLLLLAEEGVKFVGGRLADPQRAIR